MQILAQRIARRGAMSARKAAAACLLPAGESGTFTSNVAARSGCWLRGITREQVPRSVWGTGSHGGRSLFTAVWRLAGSNPLRVSGLSAPGILPRKPENVPPGIFLRSAVSALPLRLQAEVIAAVHWREEDQKRWFSDQRSESPGILSRGSDEVTDAEAEGGGGGGGGAAALHRSTEMQTSGVLKEGGASYLGPPGPGEKARLVVLGSGWAAGRLLRDVNTEIYDMVCISPRNHMVFTPLLASTCVGTLEFRSVAEPVRNIQHSLSKAPNSHFFLARALALHPDQHQIECQALDNGDREELNLGHKFRVFYDKLVVATGAVAMTFNIQGVKENAIFLREVSDAMAIRRKLLLNLMKTDIPGTQEEEKRRLLHCVVVGGGPTGVEFSGELSDFIMRDVKNRFPHVKDYIKVTLIEAREILSSFDVRLRKYAIHQLTKSGVHLVKGVVKEVKHDRIILTDDYELPYGLLVWSTGVGPSPFVNSLGLPKSPGGRIGVDEWLKVVGTEDIWAAGDCCGYVAQTGKPVLPALAQVAERQGKYLAKTLNELGRLGAARAGSSAAEDGTGSTLALPQFTYRHMGSMATVGRYKALVDLRQTPGSKGLSIEGFISWLVWRSVYLTRVISWRNRLYVAVNWATTLVFGRDITRI